MPDPRAQPGQPVPWLAIGLLSGASLAYEILLTRLFSIIHWHHFAYMIISLALLGYGASGTFLTLTERWLSGRFSRVFASNALLFALASVGCFLLAQRLPLNPLELPWDARQPLYLVAVYLLLVVPFFGAANALGMAIWQFRTRVHRVYAADLLGAGAGAVAVIGLLMFMRPERALVLIAALGVLSAALAMRGPRWLQATVILIALLAVPLAPARWISLHLSQYKALSQSLEVLGAERAAERSGPLGLVTVVRNERVPFRFAPGMSLAAPTFPPEQLGLFVDGDTAGAVTRFDGQTPPRYLDYLTSALPYHLLDKPSVLVLGAGGGSGVLQALLHRARSVDAVELNPQVVELIRDDFGDLAGHIYARADVRLHLAEARGFVRTSSGHFDLIQLDLLDAFSSTAAGLLAQTESYLYTVEAFQAYLAHLTERGLLAVTRWLRLPPRDSLKAVATAAEALRRAGVESPGAHLAMIRGWKTSTLVVSPEPLDATRLQSLRRFARERSFDLVYYPGMAEDEANRFNRLQGPILYRGIQALLGDRAGEYIRDYKFDIRPATDDRPYFFRFSRWRTLPELLRLPSRAGFSQLDWGYWVTVATLLQAVVLSIALILLPLLGLRRRTRSVAPLRRRVLVYFGAIGLGFMFLEIAFIQRLMLFLSHPLYAVSVALGGFLIFAGLGSGASRALAARKASLWPVVTALGALGLGSLAGLPLLFELLDPLGEIGRVLAGLIAIAPLAFTMGMPFPLGMARLGARAEDLMPWAWGINGCSSVIGAVLAGLLAMEIGFSGLVLAAIGLYLLAAWAIPAAEKSATQTPSPG
jgi:spermidine synthase